MDKAPDAFRTISEVADDLDVPQHVLRFWETRFAHIRPLKRGGGRRYYRPDDVDLLRGIRHLLYGEGYTIRGVQRILKDSGPKFVQAVWKSGAPQPPPATLDEGREDLQDHRDGRSAALLDEHGLVDADHEGASVLPTDSFEGDTPAPADEAGREGGAAAAPMVGAPRGPGVFAPAAREFGVDNAVGEEKQADRDPFPTPAAAPRAHSVPAGSLPISPVTTVGPRPGNLGGAPQAAEPRARDAAQRELAERRFAEQMIAEERRVHREAAERRRAEEAAKASERLRILQSALAELHECRRLLAAALKDEEP